MPELILSQYEWVDQCLTKYRHEPDANAKFETAHFPKSRVMGGVSTIQLLPEDHVVQGLLATLEFGVPNIYPGSFRRDMALLQEHYPEYLPLYEETYRFCQSYAGTCTVRDQAGIHDPARREKVAEGRKKGGAKMGATCKAQQKGIFDPKLQNPLARARNTRKGGIVTLQQRKGIFALSAKERASAGRKGAQALNSQRWVSLHDGFESTASGVAAHNRALGIPGEFKAKVA